MLNDFFRKKIAEKKGIDEKQLERDFIKILEESDENHLARQPMTYRGGHISSQFLKRMNKSEIEQLYSSNEAFLKQFK